MGRNKKMTPEKAPPREKKMKTPEKKKKKNKEEVAEEVEVEEVEEVVEEKEKDFSCHHCHRKHPHSQTYFCSTCNINFGVHCLKNSYKEKPVPKKMLSTWTCPRCRECCKCSICQKIQPLKKQVASLTAENLILRDRINCLDTNLSLKDKDCEYLRALLTDFARSKQVSIDEAFKLRDAAVIKVGILQGELQQAREDRDRQVLLVQQLINSKLAGFERGSGCTAEVDELKETSCLRDQISLLQSDLAAAKQKLSVVDLAYDDQKRLVTNLQDRLREAKNQLADGEILRKKLHNTILELKGNIRVFVRVRPLRPGAECTVTYPTSVELAGRGIDLNHHQNGQKIPFAFDKVFDQDASQEDVFKEISQLVQSAMDGFKVCIFAYGQTGSGKTYTILGRPEDSLHKGLIPRAIGQVFDTSQVLAPQGWKFKMQASMLEIYNENIRDLLAIKSNAGKDGGKQQPPYQIHHDKEGNTSVSDLTTAEVCSMGDALTLLGKAAERRSVGRTEMNEESSRSHFVFILRIHGVNESTEKQVHGVLNLMDLAGSERLSKSGATGERLKETQAINKSLSGLGDVISALLNKQEHIRFRDSKLTYLLQPCLSGHSKTLMFVTVSPDPSSFSESLCTLRFAARANGCEIGIPPQDARGSVLRGLSTTHKKDKRVYADAGFQAGQQVSCSLPPVPSPMVRTQPVSCSLPPVPSLMVHTPRPKISQYVGPKTPQMRGFIPRSDAGLERTPSGQAQSPTVQTADVSNVPENQRPVISTLTRLFTETSEQACAALSSVGS